MKACYVVLCAVICIFAHAEIGRAELIDFEDLVLPPSEHLLITNQYQHLGVLFSGEGSFSGLVYPEGYHGVANFGNSSPNIMDIGWRDEATIATFVIPGTITPTVATNVSVLTGDGHPDQETFTVESFDINGNILFSQTYTTTGSGQLIQFSGEVASIRFVVEPYSRSGICLDDFSFTVIPATALVEIDIKPGSDPNPINQGSNGLIPVAIFSSPEFDATQVDPTSVSLAGASVAVRGKGKSMAHEEDVNGDGLVDLVVQVETQGFNDLGAGGTVELTGTTFGDEDIVGYDEVIIVPKAVITSVVRDGVTEGQPEIVAGPSPGGLQEGSHAFMDRPMDQDDTRNYHWESIPAELVGADYVMTYNEDKQPAYDPKVYNVSYSVTLGRAAKLYIFVDDRYAPFAWLTDGSAIAVFADTGLDIMLNEVGGREVLQPYDVYGAEVSAGTYILGPSCDGSGNRSFYSIAASKL